MKFDRWEGGGGYDHVFAAFAGGPEFVVSPLLLPTKILSNACTVAANLQIHIEQGTTVYSAADYTGSGAGGGCSAHAQGPPAAAAVGGR